MKLADVIKWDWNAFKWLKKFTNKIHASVGIPTCKSVAWQANTFTFDQSDRRNLKKENKVIIISYQYLDHRGQESFNKTIVPTQVPVISY